MSAQDNIVARTLYHALTDLSRQLMESQARVNELERMAQEREAAVATLTSRLNELRAQFDTRSPPTEPGLMGLYGSDGPAEGTRPPDGQIDALLTQLAKAERLAPERGAALAAVEAERLTFERETALTQTTHQLRDVQARLEEAQPRAAAHAVVSAPARSSESRPKTAIARRDSKAAKTRKSQKPKPPH